VLGGGAMVRQPFGVVHVDHAPQVQLSEQARVF